MAWLLDLAVDYLVEQSFVLRKILCEMQEMDGDCNRQLSLLILDGMLRPVD